MDLNPHFLIGSGRKPENGNGSSLSPLSRGPIEKSLKHLTMRHH